MKILCGNYHVVLLVERDKTRQKGRSRKRGLNGFLIARLQPSTSEQLKINFHSKVDFLSVVLVGSTVYLCHEN